MMKISQPIPDQPTKLQGKYRERTLQVIAILPSNTYRVAEVASDGKELYVTTAHVSQLKSWKIFNESDDEGDEPGDEEADEQDRTMIEKPPRQGKPIEGGSRPTRQKRVLKRFDDFELT